MKLAYFFLSEVSVSGGMPTTVTVPCSTLSGAAITRGSSLQRRFFVCGGKAYPQTWPCRGLEHTSLPRCPDNARACSPRASGGLSPGDTHTPDILSLSLPVCTVLWAFVSQSSCHHLCALPTSLSLCFISYRPCYYLRLHEFLPHPLNRNILSMWR